MEVPYPFPFEEWLTWCLRIWIPKFQISRKSSGVAAEVRSLCNSMSDPLFGHRDGLYLGAISDTARLLIVEIGSIEQRVHTYLWSVHLSSTWYFCILYICMYTYICKYMYVYVLIYIYTHKSYYINHIFPLRSGYRQHLGGTPQLGDLVIAMSFHTFFHPIWIWLRIT